jgi:type IV pilus assembly protein PilB
VVDNHLRVAVSGQTNPDALEDLERTYGVPLALIPLEEAELQDAIRRTFAASESVVELVRDLDAAVEPLSQGGYEGTADIRDLANQPPVVRFVNLLIREAHDAGASDIHLEAVRDGLRVRLRVDGVLTELPADARPRTGGFACAWSRASSTSGCPPCRPCLASRWSFDSWTAAVAR